MKEDDTMKGGEDVAPLLCLLKVIINGLALKIDILSFRRSILPIWVDFLSIEWDILSS
jgi:hypothetical protein